MLTVTVYKTWLQVYYADCERQTRQVITVPAGGSAASQSPLSHGTSADLHWVLSAGGVYVVRNHGTILPLKMHSLPLSLSLSLSYHASENWMVGI